MNKKTEQHWIIQALPQHTLETALWHVYSNDPIPPLATDDILSTATAYEIAACGQMLDRIAGESINKDKIKGYAKKAFDMHCAVMPLIKKQATIESQLHLAYLAFLSGQTERLLNHIKDHPMPTIKKEDWLNYSLSVMAQSCFALTTGDNATMIDLALTLIKDQEIFEAPFLAQQKNQSNAIIKPLIESYLIVSALQAFATGNPDSALRIIMPIKDNHDKGPITTSNNEILYATYLLLAATMH